jgi:putative FmdB family regulatory protein
VRHAHAPRLTDVPIYDYVCSSCRHRVEVIHGIHDPGPRFCPSCGTEGSMRKALVTPAIHFKGSGWAKKDRSSTSSARTKAAGSGSGSGDGSSGDGSSGDRSSGSGDHAPTDGGSSSAGSSDAKGSSTGASKAASSAED